MTSAMTIVPLTWREACVYVEQHHRHNKPPRGCKWAIGIAAGGQLRGVALCGRPVSRHLDDGLTIEVNRTCTEGWPNANSALYGASWRIAAAMGYRRGVSYTQGAETGASLTAAGWVKLRALPARGSWAEASVALRHLRSTDGNGGMDRALWGVGDVADLWTGT
jgi:hypothetical protein